MKYWEALCASCGRVRVAQKSKPNSCKEPIRTGERSVRQCRDQLSEQQDITSKVAAAQAVDEGKGLANGS